MKPSPSDTSERCGAAPAAWLAWSVAAVPAEREQLHAAVHAVVTAPPAAAPSLGVLVRPGQAVQGCAGCGQDTGSCLCWSLRAGGTEHPPLGREQDAVLGCSSSSLGWAWCRLGGEAAPEPGVSSVASCGCAGVWRLGWGFPRWCWTCGSSCAVSCR